MLLCLPEYYKTWEKNKPRLNTRQVNFDSFHNCSSDGDSDVAEEKA